MSTWLETQRKNSNLSQIDVANILGISRPTYDRLEKGKSEISKEQAEILKKVFHVSETAMDIYITEEQVMKSKKEKVFDAVMPKENIEKFKEVLLYIINKTAEKPNIGQTALYKLLYFIDFDYFEKHFESITGAVYIRNNYGPTPISFAKVIRDLEHAGKLVSVQSKYFNYDQTRYMVTVKPEITLLNGAELKHIDDEIDRLANKTARELSELSHIDTPWRIAKDKEVLDYQHAHYRPIETSVVEYEDEM
jgi:transcriptional regulator with XRE-family HTH domain